MGGDANRSAHSGSTPVTIAAGLAVAGANFDVMNDETRLERRLDRLIEHAVNPRKAAVVIATVTTAITVLAGWLMTIVDHTGFPTPRLGNVVGGADGDDGRLRRPRPRRPTPARSWRRP